MTTRAFAIGLVMAALLNAFCYFNDFVLRQSYLVGSYLPLPVYGGLLIFVLTLNPIIVKFGRKYGFTGKELALIVALILSACYVPGRGLMHYFTTFQMLPHQFAKTDMSFKRTKILDEVPKQMLADPDYDNGRALSAYKQGYMPPAGAKNKTMPPSAIPWGAWTRSLAFWIPLFLAFSVGIYGLALTFHRQWSDHEHLAYPIIQFANSILTDEEGNPAPVFKMRSFWVGVGIVLLFHMSTYAKIWFPEQMVALPRQFDFGGLRDLAPQVVRGGGWGLFTPRIYFCAVGFAYFLSTDVSLSLGLAPWLYCYAAGCMATNGINVGGRHLSTRLTSFFHAGAFSAMFATMIYAGRRYYLSVMKRAFGLRGEDGDADAIFGFRLFALGMVLFIGQLTLVGLDWQLAVLYTLGAILIFAVTSRIVAETGAFFIHPWFFPCTLIWGVMGDQALGPRVLLIMMMVSSLLVIDPREAVMPFAAHALKLVDMQKLDMRKTTMGGIAALVIAFAVATPVTLYWQYYKGIDAVSDGWTARAVPTMAFQNAAELKTRLQEQGTLEESENTTGFARFLKISPKGACMGSFAIFFALTLICSLARLRYPKWPIHPVLFAVLGTFQSKMLGFSFLLGWLIKALVTRFGGSKVYQDIKPLMIGLIAGEMLSGVIPMIIGAIYYFITGESPKPFNVFRG